MKPSIMPGIASSQPTGSRASQSQISGRSSPSHTSTLPPSSKVASEWSVAAMWKSGDHAMKLSSPRMP